MAKEQISSEEKKPHRPEDRERTKQRPAGPEVDRPGLAGLQQLVGNRAVQRLLAQRSGNDPFQLDDETASRINQARGSGRPLDAAFGRQASAALGHDLSGVRVHTSPEANELSHQLGARAFTTGQDVFFRQGAYDPHSSSGQRLIAHELTHVVQQSTGQVGRGGGRMTVNPPGDAYEQEADTIAAAGLRAVAEPAVQRQSVPEEEEDIQTKRADATEVQRQEVPEEEEELVQTQEMEEEEEEVTT